MDFRRNVLPPVYNDNRLKEKPIPSSSVVLNESSSTQNTDADIEMTVETEENSSHSDLSTSDRDNTTNDLDMIENYGMLNENSIASVNGEDEISVTEFGIDRINDDITNSTENDPLAILSNLTGNDLVINDSATTSTENAALDSAERQNVRVNGSIVANLVIDSDVQTMVCDSPTDIDLAGVIKAEPLPVYDNHIGNDTDIDDVLNEPVEEEYDGVIMIIGASGLPQPLYMTTEKTIKRENDKMSGNLTYSLSVRICYIARGCSYSKTH